MITVKTELVFLTVCVNDKNELSGKINVRDAGLCVPNEQEYSGSLVRLNDIGSIVKKYFDSLANAIEVAMPENFVIMPDHIHLLVFAAVTVVKTGRCPQRPVHLPLQTNHIGFASL